MCTTESALQQQKHFEELVYNLKKYNLHGNIGNAASQTDAMCQIAPRQLQSADLGML